MRRGYPVWCKENITCGYRFPYWIKKVPFRIIRNIKCSLQRIQRGYCEEDVWNIDIWFKKVMPEMLKDLRDNSNAYPSDLEYEEWLGILDEMIDCLKKSDADNYPIRDHATDPEWFEKSKKDDERRGEYQKKFFSLFEKWFNALWC